MGEISGALRGVIPISIYPALPCRAFHPAPSELLGFDLAPLIVVGK
jgi:hypothetical protein